MKLRCFSPFFFFFFLSSSLYSQEPPQPVMMDGRDNMSQTVFLILLVMVFFYFIVFRPEQKRRKELDGQKQALSKGDKVTAMGIVGTVKEVRENTLILKMVDGSSCIEILKGAVSDIELKSHAKPSSNE